MGTAGDVSGGHRWRRVMLETMTRGGDRDKMGKRWWRNAMDGNGVLSNDNDAFSVRVPRMRHMKAACPESPCTPDCPQG